MRLATILSALLASLSCLGQTSGNSLTVYSVRNGLSNNTVNRIIKDSRGFIWIGTGEGLNRFDGAHFVSFFSDAAEPNSLGGNNVMDLLEYAPGQLLIATNNGLCVLNTFSNRFENERITQPALKKGSGNYVRFIFKDRKGRVYVNHSGEIDVFDGRLRFLYRLTDLPWAKPLKGLIMDVARSFEDDTGRMWLPSDNNGICFFDEKKQLACTYASNPLHYPFLRKMPVRSFYYDQSRQAIWFSAWGNGITRYDFATGATRSLFFGLPYGNEARTFNAITAHNGRILCCGSQGVYSIEPSSMQYEKLFDDPKDQGSLAYINSHTLLQDSDHLWIGSETKGMVQLPLRTSLVQQFALPFRIFDYTNFATAIMRAGNGRVYFAYGHDGLVELDPASGRTVRYALPPSANHTSIVYRLCAGEGQGLLVGTNTGLLAFDTRTKQFTAISWLPPFAARMNVTFLYRDSKGNTWMSFTNPRALAYYERATGQFHYYENYRNGSQALFDERFWITRMAEDEAGNIWMISYQGGGILCYEAATRQWKSYPASTRSAAAIGNQGLNSICVSRDMIWTGNAVGLGLVRYAYRTDSLQHFSRKNGLLSENILAISKDPEGDLFLATKGGIHYLNAITQDIRPIIGNNEDIEWAYAYIQYYDSIGHQLIYGLNDRIVILKSTIWQMPKTAISTYIDNIRVNNVLYPTDSAAPGLTLKEYQKNISIDFTSISFDRNTALWYAYKMEGVDKDWNLGRQLTTANYANLPPGLYAFQVKARVQSGVWGPQTTLHIRIEPAFWKTGWFWTLVIGAMILLAMILVRRRIAIIRKNAELKHKLSEAEMLALRAQMNPHFIFNCLAAIDNLIQVNEPDKATTYLARFAKLMRSVLESSKNNLVPFHKDYETLKLFLQLEQFRCNDKFSYELEADEELLLGDYKVPPLIIQPFVENAIHHGLLNKQQGEKKLTIHASLHPSFIRYTIQDNGVGRERAREIKRLNKPDQASYGIEITSERIHLHNRNGNTNDILISDIVRDGIAEGTAVEVRLHIDH